VRAHRCNECRRHNGEKREAQIELLFTQAASS
jgi:hypothetical protein